MIEEERVLGETENRPIIHPLKRMLYSRKVLVALLALAISLAGEFGLSPELVTNFNNMALAIIASWTAKDVATNFANGKSSQN